MPRSQENAAPQTVLGAHVVRRAEATADSPQTITQVKLRALLCWSNTLKKGSGLLKDTQKMGITRTTANGYFSLERQGFF